MVPGVAVLGARSLAQAVAVLRDRRASRGAAGGAAHRRAAVLTWRGDGRLEDLDLADVHGMADARYALEVAAAGGHHLLLSGPKGAGKTTLAERVPGLLPDLDVEQALELSAIYSLTGNLRPARRGCRPPFRAPHHSASRASVLGGGTGRVHPGEVSRAHAWGAVPRRVPAVRRRHHRVAAPAPRERRGHHRPRRGGGDVPGARDGGAGLQPLSLRRVHAATLRASRCTCAEVKRRNYRARISGPVTDRIDIVRHVVAGAALGGRRPRCPPRAHRERARRGSASARERQHDRYAGRPGASTRTCPAPSSPPRGRSPTRGAPCSSDSSTTAASPAAAPPGCTGSPGRSPTCRRTAVPGADARRRWRCGSARGPAHRVRQVRGVAG